MDGGEAEEASGMMRSPAQGEPWPSSIRSVNARAQVRLDMEDLTLLRGSAAPTLLHRCAHVLRDEPCETEDFDLSRQVTELDAFVSHNWSTLRRDKFLALALHFNFGAAVVMSLAVGSAFALLTVYGHMPLLLSNSQLVPEVRHVGVMCQVSGSVTFILVLFFWHDMRSCVRGRQSMVFLDRTCVHQTDQELKMKGIRELAAILYRSRTMVVLYSDLYLQKLWTVYELATYLLINASHRTRPVAPCARRCKVCKESAYCSRLFVRPVFLPKFFLCAVLLACVSRGAILVSLLHRSNNAFEPSLTGAQVRQMGMLVGLVPILIINYIMWWWQTELRQAQLRVEGFSISNASCLSEEDRAIVEDNIALFTAFFEFVEPGSSKAEALAAFDKVVRQEVPHVLLESVGRAGIPYKYCAAVFGVFLLEMMDDTAGKLCVEDAYPDLAPNEPPDQRELVIHLVASLVFVFAHGPIGVVVCAAGARLAQDLTGCVARLVAFIASGALVWFLLQGMEAFYRHVALGALDGRIRALVGFLLWSAFQVALTWALYRPVPATRVHITQRLRAATESFGGDDESEDTSSMDSESNGQMEDSSDDGCCPLEGGYGQAR